MFNFNFPLFRSNSYGGGSPLGGKGSGIFFFVLGLVFMVVGVFIFFDGERTKDWPMVTGTTQGVESRVEYDSDGRSETKYRYSVVYTVDGERYTSSQTSSGHVTNGESKQVAYNPGNPKDSRIKSSGDWLGWVIFLSVGVLFAVIGVITFFKNLGSGMRSATPLVTPPVQQPQPQQPQMQQPPVAPSVPPAANDGTNGSGSQPPTV